MRRLAVNLGTGLALFAALGCHSGNHFARQVGNRTPPEPKDCPVHSSPMKVHLWFIETLENECIMEASFECELCTEENGKATYVR
jgi:hypothetical protein